METGTDQICAGFFFATKSEINLRGTFLSSYYFSQRHILAYAFFIIEMHAGVKCISVGLQYARTFANVQFVSHFA